MSLIRRIGILALTLFGLVAAGCSSDVKVGAVISETGTMSSYGEKVKKGIDLATEEINAAGGIRGGQVTVAYRDDATNKEMARQVTEELIDEEGIRVIIGGISSPITLAIAPVAEEKRVILISPSASAPEISDAGDYIYRNYPSDILEGTAMAKFARDLGLERMVLFVLDNEFGAGLKHFFTQGYQSKYRSVVKSFDFRDGETAGFPAMVEEVKELAPDGIYIAAYLQDMSELLKLLDEAGVKAVLLGSASVTPDLIRMAGPASENLVYPQPPFDVQSHEPAVRAFVDAYRAKYSEDPDSYAAHGYDALKLLAQAMENAGGTHPDDVRIGFSSIKDYDGAAGHTAFDENGDVVRYPRMFIIRDGRAMPYEQFVDEGGSLTPGS
jgi:branched-chain amino acid transport system substrate-binding protein